ncbi:MAG: hypothetical protein ACYC6C_11530 [Coriobacteriia bacterium]
MRTYRSPLERPERDRRLQAARRRARIEIAVVVAIVILGTILGWRVMQPGDSSASGSQAASGAFSTAGATPIANTVAGGAEDPTPFFASYGSLQLYLPVPSRTLTELAFHQASGDKSYHMTSLLPDADTGAASDKRGTGRQVATETAGPQILTGAVLRMWRSNRSGAPDTAADIGAKPGTPVFAPVTGEVIQVKPYLLYNEHQDYEIHIQPTGWPGVDVVLIHVDKPVVQAGDRVIGGCTQLAEVRKLSDRVTHQISEYTRDGGDHVHIQLNKTATPGTITAVGSS